MTGITLLETVAGHNVIQNNINKAGAGITLLNAFIEIEGKLLLYNNTAEKHKLCIAEQFMQSNPH